MTYWDAVSGYLPWFKSVEVGIIDVGGSEIKVLVSNPKGRHVVVQDAYLVALFPERYKVRFTQLRVSVFGDGGQRSPLIVERGSAATVRVNKQFVLSGSDLGHWDIAFQAHYQKRFLWELARSNDEGFYFTCGLYVLVDDASVISGKSFKQARVHELNCEVMLRITGEFAPYQYGRELYTKEPPAQPRGGRR